ncbi:MAG TPA: cytochrome ubiquinol oxidase subunit I [Candidatus Tectomicrobia bacterium]|nr:cytochrome ubiquinol oxidase subunit I [Candidatus Tectomicrobia bacterium]
MDDLSFARAQMGLSLAFHIVFAVIGMGMPVLMVASEARWLRTRDPVALDLTHRWAKGTAILFAVGAVSGTVLSFELGLLWPRFMEFAGGIIGMPFSLEGFAFFTEAIFLGIHLYGWNRVPPRAHLLAGVVVALSGAASGVFVVTANAWMNAPTGFTMVDGRVTDVDPIAAMLNPAAFQQVVHMLLAAYVATGFGVAGVHAWFLLRDRRNAFHRLAFAIALTVGAVAIPLQVASGDLIARMLADRQPAKFAAMEGLYRTRAAAPLTVGGIADDDAMTVRWALEIPYGLSLLAHHDPHATVTGLDAFPRDEWPNVQAVHLAFDVMVGLGLLLLALAVWAAALAWRRRGVPDDPWFLRAAVAAAPLGFVAIEAGWVVTEMGRQPWIIYGVMRTSEAVTPMPGLVVPFAVFTLVYVLLAVILVVLLRRGFMETAAGGPPRPT